MSPCLWGFCRSWRSLISRQVRGWRIGYLSAAAAVLIVASGTVALVMRNAATPVVQGSSLVPVGWVSSASRLHINCAKDAEHFAAGFPPPLRELPGSLQSYLGGARLVRIFRTLGYRFNGCGPCQIPGGTRPATCFISRPRGRGRSACSCRRTRVNCRWRIARFTWPDCGGWDGDDRLRADGVVYYLVGESDEQLKSAADEMGMKVRI